MNCLHLGLSVNLVLYTQPSKANTSALLWWIRWAYPQWINSTKIYKLKYLNWKKIQGCLPTPRGASMAAPIGWPDHPYGRTSFFENNPVWCTLFWKIVESLCNKRLLIKTNLQIDVSQCETSDLLYNKRSFTIWRITSVCKFIYIGFLCRPSIFHVTIYVHILTVYALL